MASNDLIIDDKYCKTVADFCSEQGKKLDQIISKYVVILNSVADKGITKGSAHDILKMYISYAEKLKEQYGCFSEVAKSQIVSFNNKVDEADQYLF